MRYLLLILFIIFAGIGGFFSWNHFTAADAQPQEQLPPEPVGPVVTTETREVIEDDTFTVVMEDLGVSYADALTFVENAEEVFDLTSIKLGKTFKLVKEDGVPLRIEYEPGTEYMVVLHLDDLNVEKQDIAYDVEIRTADVMIENSLYLDGLAAGIDEELIIEFANVFAWELDFATAVQKGDTMRVLYEKRFRNGKEAGIGDVLAGEFVNVGTKIEGYRFEDSEGKIGYFNAEGESLVRPFLKAPLSFSRITSGFTNARFHPVLKRTTPHRAIDYGAPTGTPIFSVGDGVIKRASWNGGYGNQVVVRHNERFTTTYAHMSAYARGIRPGVRVKQGQTIGFVGSTGFSTGPHLHYEVIVNGTKINPLKVEFPKGDSIAEEEQEAFFAERDRLAAQLR